MGSVLSQSEAKDEELIKSKPIPPIIKTLLQYINEEACNPKDAKQLFVDKRISSMDGPQQMDLTVEVDDNASRWELLNIAQECSCNKQDYISKTLLLVNGFIEDKIIPNEIQILIFRYFYDLIIAFNFYQVLPAYVPPGGGACPPPSIMSEWIPPSAMRIYSIQYKTNVICCRECTTLKKLNQYIVKNQDQQERSRYIHRSCPWIEIKIKSKDGDNLLKSAIVDYPQQNFGRRSNNVTFNKTMLDNAKSMTWKLSVHEFGIKNGYILEGITQEMIMPRP